MLLLLFFGGLREVLCLRLVLVLLQLGLSALLVVCGLLGVAGILSQVLLALVRSFEQVLAILLLLSALNRQVFWLAAGACGVLVSLLLHLEGVERGVLVLE